MASDRHMEAGRKVLLALLSDAITSDVNDDACISDDAGSAIIATALANAERDGMRRAAEIARSCLPTFHSANPAKHNAIMECILAILSQAGEASD